MRQGGSNVLMGKNDPPLCSNFPSAHLSTTLTSILKTSQEEIMPQKGSFECVHNLLTKELVFSHVAILKNKTNRYSCLI